MSAIAGIYHAEGLPIERADLGRMLETLARRGPDGAGIWIDGAVGLGHRMLWTTPESLDERLPWNDEARRLAITADARIDNREELMAALGIAPSAAPSDSALILKAYERWGEHCPERLLGDFAFAIWDGKDQSLFCARDHSGVKPFFYYQTDRVFAFATEIRAILRVPGVPRRLNELRIVDFLLHEFGDQAITFYQGILRLPPAHCLTVRRGEVRLRAYWSLDPTREFLRLGSNEEYAEAFGEIFRDAVRCRLRSIGPPGSFLSGGLDSSSIVCAARDLLAKNGGTPLHTFSAIFDDVPRCDERSYIGAVLASGGLIPHFLRGDRISPFSNTDPDFWHEDDAFQGANLFICWNLHRQAGAQGVRVLLDGYDGDTVVSHGTGYVVELARQGRWLALASDVWKISKHYEKSPWKVYARLAWLHGLKPRIPWGLVWRAEDHLRRALRLRNRTTLDAYPAINPDFARRVGLEERARAHWKANGNRAQTEREDHYQRLSSGIFPVGFEVLSRAASAARVEPRYPFFDKRLVEFCLDLPPQQKSHRGWNRVIMRRAMDRSLPAQVQWRGGKSDISPNLAHVLRTFDRDVLDDVIHRSRIVPEYFNVNHLRNAYRNYITGRSKRPEADEAVVLDAATLGLWLGRTGLACET
jgi:asparagine synthase (glutamine-hydrolysing)